MSGQARVHRFLMATIRTSEVESLYHISILVLPINGYDKDRRRPCHILPCPFHLSSQCQLHIHHTIQVWFKTCTISSTKRTIHMRQALVMNPLMVNSLLIPPLQESDV